MSIMWDRPEVSAAHEGGKDFFTPSRFAAHGPTCIGLDLTRVLMSRVDANDSAPAVTSHVARRILKNRRGYLRAETQASGHAGINKLA